MVAKNPNVTYFQMKLNILTLKLKEQRDTFSLAQKTRYYQNLYVRKIYRTSDSVNCMARGGKGDISKRHIKLLTAYLSETY